MGIALFSFVVCIPADRQRRLCVAVLCRQAEVQRISGRGELEFRSARTFLGTIRAADRHFDRRDDGASWTAWCPRAKREKSVVEKRLIARWIPRGLRHQDFLWGEGGDYRLHCAFFPSSPVVSRPTVRSSVPTLLLRELGYYPRRTSGFEAAASRRRDKRRSGAGCRTRSIFW